MRAARPRVGLLLLILLSGCGSCQRASDTDGTGEQPARSGPAAPAGGAAANAEGRIAVPTLARAPEFPATQPPAPPQEAAPEAAEEPTALEPFGQGDCVVIIDADPDFGSPPLSVNFSVEAQCVGGTPTYTWDFGDHSPPSTEAAPVHVYQKAGEYTVTLKAAAPDGSQASDDIAITVEDSLEE